MKNTSCFLFTLQFFLSLHLAFSSHAGAQTCTESPATVNTSISGNLDAWTSVSAQIPEVSRAGQLPLSTTTWGQLSNAADFSTAIGIFDANEHSHLVLLFFFHTAQSTFTVRAYVASDEVDPIGSAAGLPRQVGSESGWEAVLLFGGDGQRTNPLEAGAYDLTMLIPWNDGSVSSPTGLELLFTSFSANSNITSINPQSAELPDTDGDGTVDCADACPFDVSKDSAGTCGCDRSDQDINSNGAADCLDPSSATIPAKPVIRATRTRARVSMQRYPGKVSYSVTIRRARTIKRYNRSAASLSIKIPHYGLWSACYRVSAGEGAMRVVSRKSCGRFRVR